MQDSGIQPPCTGGVTEEQFIKHVPVFMLGSKQMI